MKFSTLLPLITKTGLSVAGCCYVRTFDNLFLSGKHNRLSIFLILVSFSFSTISNGQAGFFGTNEGGLISYNTGSGQVNSYAAVANGGTASLGSLSTFTLLGGIINTYKGGNGNACGGTLYYTIYPQGSRPGSPTFSSISLGFVANATFNETATPGNISGATAGDQEWGTNGQSINILNTANTSGTWVLEVYWTFTGNATASTGCGTSFYQNNGGSNYTWTFTNANVPTIATTVAVNSITNTTASSGGQTITGSGITVQGLVWSKSTTTTTPSLTTYDGYNTGGGTGGTNFTDNLTTLSPQTLYYTDAYATNSSGTGYGPILSFYTLSNPPTGQASLLATSSPTTTGFSYTWSGATFPASGASTTGYILLASTGTPALSNGNGAAPIAAGGTIIVNSSLAGTATSYTSTGTLSPNTTYNFILIPYTWDGADAGTYDYLTTSATTATGTTLTAPVITGYTSITTNGIYTGETVTVNGTNLSGLTAVSFGGVAAMSFTSISSTQFTAVVALGTNAPGNISITTGGGSATYAYANYWGYRTTSNGDWSTASTWLGSILPSVAARSVTVANAITVTTNLSGTQTGAFNILSGASVTFGASGYLKVQTSYPFTNAGTVNMASGGTLEFVGNANFTNNNVFTSGTGTVYFSGGTATINGSTAITFYNVTCNAAITISTIPITINNNLQINGGDIATASAISYGTNSTLIYNEGYGVYNEWTANATSGNGVPQNVTIGNGVNSAVNFGSNTGYYQLNGNLTISSGSSLTLSTSSTSPGLKFGGNFTNNGIYTDNSRGTWFVGTANEIITSSAALSLNYLILNSTYNLQLGSSNITLNGNTSALEFLNSGGLDLNQQTIKLNASGTILLNATGNKTIVSTGGTGTFSLLGTNTLTATSGTLTTNSNVALTLGGGSFTISAANALTVQGTFQLNSGAYIATATAPVYSSGSTLIYNSGGTYGASNEWTAGATSGAGVPYNVQIGNGAANSSLNLNAGTYIVTNNLTFSNNTGAALTTSGTLNIGGNWINNTTNVANYNGGSAVGTVVFNSSAAQSIGGSNVNIGGYDFNSLNINNTSGISNGVTLNTPITVGTASAGILTLTAGVLNTTTTNIATIKNTSAGAIAGGGTTTYVNGPLNRTLPANLSASGSIYNFPVGDATHSGGAYLPFSLTTLNTGATAPIIQVQATNTGSGGSADGTTLTAISTSEFWHASVVSGNFTNASVSLTRQSALGSINAIGNSASQGGSYSSLFGTISGTSIINSNSTSLASGYFVLGTLPGPVISSVTSSNSANNTGYTGSTITITGTDLGALTSLTFGGTTYSTLVSNSNTQIVVTLGIGTSGTISLTDPAGTGTYAGFTYLGYITQAAADYNTATTWLGNILPPAGASVTINNNGVTISGTSNSAATATINSGANLVFNNSPAALTITTLNNNGTLTISGTGALTATTISNSGTINYSGTGSITTNTITNSGTMAWTAAGILNISASGTFTNNSTFTGGTGTVNFQGAGTLNGSSATTFNNLTINTGAVTLSTIPTINNTLQINGGNITAAPIYGPSSTLYYNTGTYARYVEWNATGISTIGTTPGYPNNVTINSGIFDVYNGASGVARALNGTLTVNNGATMNFNAMNAAFTVGVNEIINTGGIINMNTMSGTVSITGNLTDAGTLNMGTMTKAISVTGSINLTGTLTLSGSAGGNINVNGNWANNGGTFTNNARTVTFTGSAVQTISGSTSTGFGYLTINNSAGGVTISQPITVANQLSLTNGIATTSTANTLTVTNTATTAVTGGSTSSYISGPLNWALPASLSSSANIYNFPVGDAVNNGGAYLPFSLTTITTGATGPVIQVQATNTGSGGSADGTTLVAISNTEYWNASIISGNYTNGSVSVTRQATFAGINAVGRATTKTGVYSSLAGTVSGTSVLNSNLTGTNLGFFVLATTPGSWIGVISTDWNTTGNWAGGVLPTSATNVIIPSGTPFSPSIRSANAVTNNITINASATLTMSVAYNLSISSGGTFTNNGTFTATSGTVIFLGAGTISGSSTTTFNDLTLDGSTNFSTAPVINDTLQLNTGTAVSGNAPTYLCSSTLLYNSGSALQARGVEWASGVSSGAGYPGKVHISNNTGINGNASGSNNLALCSDLTIDVGSALYMDWGSTGSSTLTVGGNTLVNGSLSLGYSSGGDLYMYGNFTIGASGVVNYATACNCAGNTGGGGRALQFIGAGTQTITYTPGGTLTIPIIDINKSSGNVQLATGTNVTIPDYESTNNSLKLFGGGLDLNGQILTIYGSPNAAGYYAGILVSGGARTITGIAGSTLAITANSFWAGVSAVSLDTASGGSLITDVNVLVTTNVGFAPTPLTTIKGTLQLNQLGGASTSNGFISDRDNYVYATSGGVTNISGHCIFGPVSTLIYSDGGAFSRNIEWDAVGIGTIGVTPGFPNNVIINNSTFLNIGDSTTTSGLANRAIAGSLTIQSGDSLKLGNMDDGANHLYVAGDVNISGTLLLANGTSSTSPTAGDIYVGGNWRRYAGGVFNYNAANPRAVTFNGNNTTADTIIAPASTGEIFAYAYLTKTTTSAKVILADSVTIENQLGLNEGSFDLANSNLTIVSGRYNTADIGQTVTPLNITLPYSGTGRFVVQRFFAAHRSWRLITAPLTPTGVPTINQAWQESSINTSNTLAGIVNPVPYHGTLITGPYNGIAGYSYGFDPGTQPNSSIYYYNSSNQWAIPATTTSTKVDAYPGWMLFVRGSRDYIIGTQYTPADTTTLDPHGEINTGPQTTSSSSNGFKVIGNPYASAFNFHTTTKSGLGDILYEWDPELTGSNSVGAFITLVWNGSYYSSAPQPISPIDTLLGRIESSSAFVVNFASAGSLTINESDKTTANALVFRPEITNNLVTLRANLYAYNSDGTISLNDGTLTMFNNSYNNAVDGADALKFTTVAENIASKRNGSLLAVELRQPVISSDSVFYNLSRLSIKNYKLQLIGANLAAPGLTAYLEDTLLHTSTSINLADTTNVDFSIPDEITATNSIGRFIVVFKQQSGSPLPVTFTTIDAWQEDVNSNNILVKWDVANEVGISQYEIEKSTDGINFSVLGSVNAIDKNSSETYTWLDANGKTGNNFYRIESIGTDGKIQYSRTVKVSIGNMAPAISIYPNPVSGGIVNVQFNNMPKGMYGLRVLSTNGQVMATEQITHDGGSATKIITFNNYLAGALYNLEVINPDNSTTITTFIAKEK